MTYEQIRNIDPKAEGKIKATYAMLYNKEGKKLFALQREDCSYLESLVVGKGIEDMSLILPSAGKNTYFVLDTKDALAAQRGETILTDFGAYNKSTLIETQKGEKISASEHVIDFRWDMPVVKATGVSGKRIPVRLIKEAVELIRKKTDRPKYTWYKVLVSCKKVKWGDWFHPQDVINAAIYEGYEYPNDNVLAQSTIGKHSISSLLSLIDYPGRLLSILKNDEADALRYLATGGYITNENKIFPEVYYDIQTPVISMDETRYSSEYEELLSKLDTNSIFYVNPNAFDWNATTVNNATVEREENGKVISVNLDDAINEAKEKYDKAKAILAVAGSTIIF